MNLNPEELDQVEMLGARLMSINDVAIVIQKELRDVVEAYSDHSSELYKRYMRGFLLTQSKINDAEIKLALLNSSPAQASVGKKITATKIENRTLSH